MVTMQLSLNIDAQKFIQQLQIHNEQVEEEVQKGLDKAFEELAESGKIVEMIQQAVKKNIMDSFSRWIFQADIRKQIEEKLTNKLAAKIEIYTDTLVNEIAEKLNLPKD